MGTKRKGEVDRLVIIIVAFVVMGFFSMLYNLDMKQIEIKEKEINTRLIEKQIELENLKAETQSDIGETDGD